MKILLVNQFFWPDAAATAGFLTHLATKLVSEGHEVTVISGNSVYAKSDAAPPPEIRILRVRDFPFGRKFYTRLLSYTSFYAGAAWKIFSMSRPDIVVTLTTPPLLSVLGLILKKTRGVKFFVWQMDVYPDIAIDLGVLHPRSWITRVLRAAAYYSERQADGVITLGECMRERLLAHGVASDRLHVAELWADGYTTSPRPCIQTGGLNVLYSGNLGHAHDIETICGAMARLRSPSRFLFRFAGSGARYESVREYCRQHDIQNASFEPFGARKRLEQTLTEASIGLVTQRDNCLGLIVPSKFYNLLAAGRPVLFIGPPNATPGRIIEQYSCGWVVRCGEIDRLAALLEQLASNPGMVAEAGRRAYEAFADRYTFEKGLNRLLEVLEVRKAA